MHQLKQSTSENRRMHTENTHFGSSEHFSDELSTQWLTTVEILFKFPFPYKTTSLWGKKRKANLLPKSLELQPTALAPPCPHSQPVPPSPLQRSEAWSRSKTICQKRRCESAKGWKRALSALPISAASTSSTPSPATQKFTQKQRLLRLLWLFIGIKTAMN